MLHVDSDMQLDLQASRLAAEGLVGIATAQHKAAIVEVCTDVQQCMMLFNAVSQATVGFNKTCCHRGATRRPLCALQVNSETDFVAKNERFRELVKSIAQTALDADLPVTMGQSCILVVTVSRFATNRNPALQSSASYVNLAFIDLLGYVCMYEVLCVLALCVCLSVCGTFRVQ